MKITFFIGSMQGGGAERVISILANHYAQKGWDVEIALLLGNKVGYKLDNRIKLVNLTGKSSSYFKNLPGWIWKIRRYLKTARPDRVVSFIGRINALVLLSAIGIRIPIVVSERNDPRHDGRSPFMLWCCNQGYKRKASAIVFQTEYEASCFSPSLQKKSFIVPNPIEIHDEPASPEGQTIATAGRLIAQKNHAMLIDAISLLHREMPEISANIYGDGPLKNTLGEQIDRLELGDHITLCGNVSDLHTRIKKAALFVLTSEYEGLSNALIEAMLLGLPCISTDYPGADEIIRDGENGLLVPKGDAVALCEAMRRVLCDNELREKLAEAARKTAENYKTEVVIQKWEATLETE